MVKQYRKPSEDYGKRAATLTVASGTKHDRVPIINPRIGDEDVSRCD